MIIGIKDQRGVITLIEKPPLKWWQRWAQRINAFTAKAVLFMGGFVVGALLF